MRHCNQIHDMTIIAQINEGEQAYINNTQSSGGLATIYIKMENLQK